MKNDELKALREAHGMTQKALADLLGYHPNYIARIERGEHPIIPRVAMLCHALLDKKNLPHPIDYP